MTAIMNTTAILDTLAPQTVQLRTHSIDALRQAAEAAGLHFHLIHLTGKKSKAALLEAIARELHFPAHFGCNLDALHDCLTELNGGQVIVLEALTSDHATDTVLQAFKDAAQDFAKRGEIFRVLHHPVDTD
jgi:RNAse (barnase) inhibitor barstar